VTTQPDKLVVTQEALKPCPFCGGPAMMREGHRDHWKVECVRPACSASSGGWHPAAKAEAIDAWNTRPNQSAEAEREAFRTVFLPAILHGDETHRAWLRAAVDAYLAGEPVPPPTGKGSSQVAAEAAARRALDRLPDEIDLFRIMRSAGRSDSAKAKAVATAIRSIDASDIGGEGL